MNGSSTIVWVYGDEVGMLMRNAMSLCVGMGLYNVHISYALHNPLLFYDRESLTNTHLCLVQKMI